jgi:hypothetical protein
MRGPFAGETGADLPRLSREYFGGTMPRTSELSATATASRRLERPYTPELRAGETQHVAQDPEQRHVRRKLDLAAFTIHRERDHELSSFAGRAPLP